MLHNKSVLKNNSILLKKERSEMNNIEKLSEELKDSMYLKKFPDIYVSLVNSIIIHTIKNTKIYGTYEGYLSNGARDIASNTYTFSIKYSDTSFINEFISSIENEKRSGGALFLELFSKLLNEVRININSDENSGNIVILDEEIPLKFSTPLEANFENNFSKNCLILAEKFIASLYKMTPVGVFTCSSSNSGKGSVSFIKIT